MDDETLSLLESINKSLLKIVNADTQVTELAKEECDPVEPEKQSEDAPEEPYGYIVYASDIPDDWSYVEGYSILKWKCEGDDLLLKYRTTHARTSWDVIERLARIPIKKRGKAIWKKIGGKGSSNMFSAYSRFTKLYEEGKIKRPANTDKELKESFESLQDETDPDAVFKPMLTSYSTRPDPNCGKAEDIPEAI
ncbi:MAG: hypothetical protein PHE44_12715 [Proteiniphilum sp.]|nr:hypothetical protein [Proteiniphilum sp.]